MIPFNKPYLTGKELGFIQQAHSLGRLSGDGFFTARCNGWIESNFNIQKALMTQSCTAALEMAAILVDIQPGDEVITAANTFVATVGAINEIGCKPVFVDVDDTFCMNVNLIEKKITKNTKAILPVHYSGYMTDMIKIKKI